MRKRLVSILMALCMAVSLLPVQALAADDAYTVGEDTRAKVRLYSGSLVPEENCATLTLADGTVTVYIHTEERLPVVLADTSGKYVGGDLTIYQNVSKPLTVHKAAKSITVADGKRVSELIIAGDASHAHSAHTAPTTMPTKGRQASIFRRAVSLHIFFGQGMARNIPHAMKNP